MSNRHVIPPPFRPKSATKVVRRLLQGASYAFHSTEGESNLWDQLWTKLTTTFGKNFQLQVPFSSYNWPDPQPGYMSIDTYDLFNERPMWSAAGKRQVSATGLYEAYGNVIKYAPDLAPTPQQQEQIKQLDGQINDARAKQDQDEQASFQAFVAEVKRDKSAGIPPPKDLSDWREDNGWMKALQTDKLQADKLTDEKAQILKTQYPQNAEVLDAWTPPGPDATTTSKAFMRCFIGTSKNSYWKALYSVRSPEDIHDYMSTGGQTLSCSLNSSHASSNMKHSWAGGSTGFSIDFFSIYASGSWEKFDLTESGESVSLTVTFKKIDSFPIGTAGWYDGGYLAHLATNNKWAPGYSKEKVFGKDGMLPLKTTNFLACIGMTISIKISQSSFERHQQQWKAAGGVQIGPFTFGGDGGQSSDDWNKSAEDSTFTVKLTGKYPYIIGYLVAKADGTPF